ncbi:MAG: hypothetical protein R3315_04110 [Woeseiaceae bacterium]|nr:hypothetical protein [Woeseiaceae bacterium]
MNKTTQSAIFLTLGWFLAAPAIAAEAGSRAGHGHVSLTYQYNTTNGFEGSSGPLPIGTIDTQVLNLEVDYNLTDRLTIVAGIPYVSKRYNGSLPHDPLLLNPPRPFVENVDLGDWNSGFQDLHLGVRYLAKSGPLSIEPYAFLGVPSQDYPFFGHAAIGQQLTKFEIGSSFLWYPGLSNAYYRAEVGYVFVEKTLGVSVNHWNLKAEVGYQFGQRLTGRLFALRKEGSGLNFPAEFPGPLDDERWYQHDRLLKHNFMNVGVGADWWLNDSWMLAGNYMTMVWAQQVNDLDFAWTLSLTRTF